MLDCSLLLETGAPRFRPLVFRVAFVLDFEIRKEGEFSLSPLIREGRWEWDVMEGVDRSLGFKGERGRMVQEVGNRKGRERLEDGAGKSTEVLEDG